MKNMLPIGIVASGATRGAMTFYATERIQTDYVCVQDGPENRIIFEVLREVVQNDRLTQADTVRFIEPGDDYRRYNVYVGEAIPVACLNKSGQPRYDAYAIAAPGSQVRRATNEELAQVYDIDAGPNRHRVGTLLHQYNVDVCLDMDQLLSHQAHLAVVGRTGSGKSWFVRHILEFLKMQYIVFSPTDEYDLLRTPHETWQKKNIVLRFNQDTAKLLFNLNPSEQKLLRNFMKNGMEDRPYAADELSETMAAFFRQSSLTKRENNYQLSFLKDEEVITESPLPQYAKTLCQKIEDTGFWLQKVDTDPAEKPSSSAIYNLQGCRRSEEERIIYSTLFPILERRKERFHSEDQTIPAQEHIVIVLEEAQNYAPSNRTTLCKDLLVDIARTGRKYGLHILLLSQRPRYIDQTILSQCGGGLFFNLPNPEDVDYVMSSASLNRSAPFKQMIQNFDTGECILLRAEKSCRDLLCKISSFEDI